VVDDVSLTWHGGPMFPCHKGKWISNFEIKELNRFSFIFERIYFTKKKNSKSILIKYDRYHIKK